jgi:hypothetical protein
LAAFRNRPGFLLQGDQSLQVELHEVSADFLPLLGVAPVLGAAWSEPSARQAQPAMISYAIWQELLGGARDVVGRTILISPTQYEISGVMPEGFRCPSSAAGPGVQLSPSLSIWVPFVPNRAQRMYRGNRGLRILGNCPVVRRK